MRVIRHPPVPAQNSHVEIKQRARVAAGNQNGEEGDDTDQQERYPQKQQNDIVRDSQYPFDEPEPTGEVWIPGALDMYRIGCIGRAGNVRGCGCHGTRLVSASRLRSCSVSASLEGNADFAPDFSGDEMLQS